LFVASDVADVDVCGKTSVGFNNVPVLDRRTHRNVSWASKSKGSPLQIGLFEGSSSGNESDVLLVSKLRAGHEVRGLKLTAGSFTSRAPQSTRARADEMNAQCLKSESGCF
jgi:hypothetical protein